jgi:sarcosine oxidase subunit alpha
MLLRTEKGYLHVGVDTDGNTMPQDIGWARAIENKPADFIGRRSTRLPVGSAPGRLQFTGIELLDPLDSISSGAHVLCSDGEGSAGYVTSAFRSPTLERTVALGIVADAREREGETVRLFYQGAVVRARLVPACAYDPAGDALRA